MVKMFLRSRPLLGLLLRMAEGAATPHTLVTPCEGCHRGFERRGLALVSQGGGGLSLEPERDSPHSQMQTIYSPKPLLSFPTSPSPSPAISSTWNALASTRRSFI